MYGKSGTYNIGLTIKNKLTDYAQLSKARLTMVVVFSALAGYMLAAGSIDPLHMIMLTLGGFLVTAASNTINQIIEKDIDALMNRTKGRPLAADRMSYSEAIAFAGITGVSGLLILLFYFNPLTSSLAAVALLTYAFIYTPMKRISPVAVAIGAIPGALPPLLGYASVIGSIDQFAIWLFLVQFIWQFPHFWSIAYVSYNDYSKAGIFLLPHTDKDSSFNSIMNISYILILIPLFLVAFLQSQIGMFALISCTILTILFVIPGFMMHKKKNVGTAKKLMFASFLYLPLMLIMLYIDKI